MRSQVQLGNEDKKYGGKFSMSHRHKSLRFAKSFQKKQIRIREKQELRKEIRQSGDSQRESEELLVPAQH